jgi:hypothetical protein
MATVLLLMLAAACCWAVGVYLFPLRSCGKCGGTGRKTRHLNRRHFDLCKRCAGTGHLQRPGARLVHRAVLSARTQWARERQQRRDRKADQRATPPRRLDGNPRHRP